MLNATQRYECSVNYYRYSLHYMLILLLELIMLSANFAICIDLKVLKILLIIVRRSCATHFIGSYLIEH